MPLPFLELNKNIDELMLFYNKKAKNPPSDSLRKALMQMREYAKVNPPSELELQIYKYAKVPLLKPGPFDAIDGMDLDANTNTQANWLLVSYITTLCHTFDMDLVLTAKFIIS